MDEVRETKGIPGMDLAAVVQQCDPEQQLRHPRQFRRMSWPQMFGTYSYWEGREGSAIEG